MKELRFSHYTEKLERNAQLIKNHLNSLSTSPSRKIFLTTRQKSNTPETIDKVREQHRYYLSLHIQEELKKRDNFSKTIEKLKRKENLEKKIREEIENKKKNDEQKREVIEERLKALNSNKKPSMRNRTISPKTEKEGNFSRVSVRFSQSIDSEDIQEKLRMLDEKLGKSKERHEVALKEKTEKISNHTQKVGKLRSCLSNNKEQSSINRVQDFVNKLNGVENRREKFRNEFQEKVKKQQERLIDKQVKIRQNLEEVLMNERKRVKIIEDKMNRTLENMKSKNKEMKFERELRSEKVKLKEEDTLENVARIKRTELLKKLKIIEKHSEIDKKLGIMKEEKDKVNEKKREHAYKTVIEKVKLKDLKLLVEKTSDSKKMAHLLDIFYKPPPSLSNEESPNLHLTT